MKVIVFISRLLILILLLTLFNSCDLDQVEIQHSDFNTADKAGLFGQGWIPSELVFNSMTNIYQRTNLDLNSCIFSYNLSKSDFKIIQGKIKPQSVKFEIVHHLKISSEWIKSVNKLNHYSFFDTTTSDTVYLAVDKENYKIYGWRK